MKRPKLYTFTIEVSEADNFQFLSEQLLNGTNIRYAWMTLPDDVPNERLLDFHEFAKWFSGKGVVVNMDIRDSEQPSANWVFQNAAGLKTLKHERRRTG